MTAFVPYVTFMKHAKKVAKGRVVKARPILSTVYHSVKYVAVTDSHRLYIATGLYKGEEKTLDAQTGQEVDRGKYPEAERLIADSANAEYTHDVSVGELYDALRAIEIAGRLNKSTDLMQIQVNDDLIRFKTDGKTAFDVEYSEGNDTSVSEIYTITLSIKYLKEAIHVLKDAKVERCKIEYFGATRPLQIRAGNFTALVLPVRTSY